MWESILEALIDSLKTLPILLVVYFLLELIEFKSGDRYANHNLLSGKASPIYGAFVGCMPQCGVSVITTDLFAKKSISIGALVAVYISTSDEALPILLSNPSKIVSLLALMGTKIILAILVGYLAIWLYPIIFKRQLATPKNISAHVKEPKVEEESVGCCHHHIEHQKKYDFKHPLIHSLKIFAYILIINIIMGSIMFAIGEENVVNFLSSSKALQPLFACLIGLIPNCASSVLITQLYLLGGLSFGSIVAGLSVNAGLGMLLLFKQNKNVAENIFIVILILSTSLIAGYLLHFLI